MILSLHLYIVKWKNAIYEIIKPRRYCSVTRNFSGPGSE